MKQQNIIINQGCNFSMVLNIKDADGNSIGLENYSARAQVRPNYADITPNDFVVFTCVLNSQNSTLTLSMNSTTTEGITFSRGIYDVELVNPTNEVERILKGTVKVEKEVTR